MNSVGIVLDRIRERRVRAGYRDPPPPREHMPPDLAEPWARYPTVALLCFLAVVGGAIAVVMLLFAMLVTANVKPKPAAIPKAAPVRYPNRAISDAMNRNGFAAVTPPADSDAPQQEETDSGDAADLKKTGTFSGTITFDGDPPESQMIPRPAPAAPIADESLLVDPETRGIANVVVFLDKAPPGRAMRAKTGRSPGPARFRRRR